MLDDLMLSCLANIFLDLQRSKSFLFIMTFFARSRVAPDRQQRVEARAGYFPIPARLLTNWRCSSKYRIKIGSVAIVTEASSKGQFEA
jgi:hypothetical protein